MEPSRRMEPFRRKREFRVVIENRSFLVVEAVDEKEAATQVEKLLGAQDQRTLQKIEDHSIGWMIDKVTKTG